MQSNLYLRAGRMLFAMAILSIGIIHLVARNFPVGLLPVPASVPGRMPLVYISGIALAFAGIMMLIDKYAYRGALVGTTVLLLMTLCLHLPLLLMHLHSPGDWTGTFEVVALLGGALILAESVLPVADKRNNKLFVIGLYAFAISLFVFGVQHYMYLDFIVGLIPAWLPGRKAFAWIVMIAFFAAFVSLVIRRMAYLSASLLALMFLIWVLILHLPRVIANPKIEPEWTSMFIALAMCGISLLIAGTVKDRKIKD